MATIPSGAMRHKITIEEDTGTSRNAVGERTASWAYKATAFAQIKQLSGSELVEAQQKRPNTTHSITTHFQNGITSAMRIKWHPTQGSTSTLGIESVDNVDYGNHTLVLLAKETG